jgi:hypothetical protein
VIDLCPDFCYVCFMEASTHGAPERRPRLGLTFGVASAVCVALTVVVGIEAGVLSAIALFVASTLLLMVALATFIGRGGAPEARPKPGARRGGVAAWRLSRRFTRMP